MRSDSGTSWTYRRAGVDLEKVGRARHGLERLMMSTLALRHGKVGEVYRGAGHYAGLIKIGGKRLLAIHTDGVGTKVLIAQAMNNFSTVGIDCVAMNVNDVVCVGAEPLALVDYIALREMNEELVEEIGLGLVEGARRAQVAIVGGETAVMPDVIAGKGRKAFDLAGSCVGVVREGDVILGKRIRPDDVIIGLESTGIHSNGLTLARKVLLKRHGMRGMLPNSKISIGEALLEPTRIYSCAVLNVIQEHKGITGLAHITGGAFSKLGRLALGRDLGFSLETMPEPQGIYKLIQEEGKVSWNEMYRTFNMGIGFCIISRRSAARKMFETLEDQKMEAHEIGRVVSRRGVFLNGERIA